jgi:glyoxylase-like metal-dependent hydrolase (beta-lactamase superfamily II)
VIASHHHFDHSGGLEAAVAEGATIIAHDVNKPFLEKALAATSNVSPDRLAKSGKKGTVEGVGARRTLTDGTRTVDIHQISDNVHHGGIVMVHLPKEKLLVEADVYTPPALHAPPATTVNPTWVSLADNIKRLNLAVDQLLPLHGGWCRWPICTRPSATRTDEITRAGAAAPARARRESLSR